MRRPSTQAAGPGLAAAPNTLGALAVLGTRAVLGALAVLTALAGCSGQAGGGSPRTAGPRASAPPASSPATPAPPSGSAAPPPASPSDWIAYHHDAARTGYAPATPPPGRLVIAWSARLDGAVYGQPLAIGRLVIAATEGDSVYGLDRANGRVRWRVHVGSPAPLASLPCGDIDPLGITGTPVYDRANGLVYAVAETSGYHHVLIGVSVADGRLRVRRDIPAPDGQPRYDQQRAALTLERGRVYVAFGGLEGDCGPYRGSVVGIPTSGRGPLVAYTVPTARMGGIWAPGGPVIGTDGTIYVSAGNGAATSAPFDHSDSVTALSPSLRRTGFFAPQTWASDNAGDLDLGSMSPALLPGGRLLAVGKRGIGYVLNGSRLGGVGGQLASGRVCAAYGGAATRGAVAYVPCGEGGMAAVDTAGGRIRVRWRGPDGSGGSPVVGGGAVWVANWDSGILYALDPATGRTERQIRLGAALPHFVSPTLSGRLALVGAMTGVVAVSGA